MSEPLKFPPSFPSNHNQVPRLPSEPQLYEALPVRAPSADPFYRPPSDLADRANGDPIRSRSVGAYALGVRLPVAATQILYRTTDSFDRPTVTVTTVLIPGIPWIGSPRPLVSYQEAIDSSSSQCNPSFTIRAGTFKEIALLQSFLEQGMAVAIPDFDGQDNAWLQRSEGAAVLDGIRAVKRERNLPFKNSAAGLIGYSGGGTASAWAAARHRDYAPELSILGSAQGGVVGDLPLLLHVAGKPQPGLPGASNWLPWLLLRQIYETDSSLFNPASTLTSRGQAIFADAADRCIFTSAASTAWRPIDFYLKPGVTISNPKLDAFLRENTLSNPKLRPDIPVLQYHAFYDEIVPPTLVRKMIDNYWRNGANIRFVTVPLPEHITVELSTFVPATVWLSAVLRGASAGPRFKADLTGPEQLGPYFNVRPQHSDR